MCICQWNSWRRPLDYCDEYVVFELATGEVIILPMDDSSSDEEGEEEEPEQDEEEQEEPM